MRSVTVRTRRCGESLQRSSTKHTWGDCVEKVGAEKVCNLTRKVVQWLLFCPVRQCSGVAIATLPGVFATARSSCEAPRSAVRRHQPPSDSARQARFSNYPSISRGVALPSQSRRTSPRRSRFFQHDDFPSSPSFRPFSTHLAHEPPAIRHLCRPELFWDARKWVLRILTSACDDLSTDGRFSDISPRAFECGVVR